MRLDLRRGLDLRFGSAIRVDFRLGLSVALALAAATVGCASPHSTGALWTQQNHDQEMALFRLTDAQRAATAQTFELGLVDASLTSEHQRITQELQTCPGASHPLSISASDQLRDGMRIRAQSDPTRLAQIANIALADWYSRRAAATGSAQLCQQAQAALAGTISPDTSTDLITSLPPATVSRDQRETTATLSTDPPMVAIGAYAMGQTDTLYAAAPLPQYLARVYGGFLLAAADSPTRDAETAATLVDQHASAYPDWEPDALYAALRGAGA